MKSNKHIITLNPVLDIIAASNLKEQLVEKIDNEGDVIVDGGQVERIMMPCIQLIVAADIILSKKQSEIKLINASDELVCALKDSGLEKQYSKWSN